MSQNRKQSIEEVLNEIREYILETKVDIAEMKVDVRHHIKRSDAHETLLLQLSTFKERAIGAIGFIAFLASLLTIYAVFQ